MLTNSLELGHSNVHDKAETMIRNYIQNKTGFAKKDANNPVKLSYTDLLGNQLSDEEEVPEETFLQQATNKKYKTKKEHDRLKKIAEKKGLCTWCYGKDHKRETCPKRKKDLEMKKRKVLESGRVWYNGDGTVTNPDGSIAPDKKLKPNVSGPNSNGSKNTQEEHSVKFAMASDISPEECLFDLDSDNEMNQVIIATEEMDMPGCVNYTGIVKKFLASKVKNKGILDTGCAKAVAGSAWIGPYMEGMGPDDKKHVKKMKSNAKFKFGDGRVYKSLARYICPIYMGGVQRFIVFDEVSCSIPLLISLELAKRMDLRISFKHDTAQLPGGPKFRLIMENGRYWTSVGKESSLEDVITPEENHEDMNEDLNVETQEADVETVLCINSINRILVSKVFDEGKVKEQLLKLHIQMAHAPYERFVKRLKLGKAWTEDMEPTVKEIYKNCGSKICRSRKETQFVKKSGVQEC